MVFSASMSVSTKDCPMSSMEKRHFNRETHERRIGLKKVLFAWFAYFAVSIPASRK
jgi:hypothetical protein